MGRVALFEKGMDFDEEVPIIGDLGEDPSGMIEEGRGLIGIHPGGGIEEDRLFAGKARKNLLFSELVIEGLVFLVMGEAIVAGDCIALERPKLELLEHFDVEIAIEKNGILIGIGS